MFQDDIIPENVRKTIEEQEKTKEMEDLYLPPRRKNMQQNSAESSKFILHGNNNSFSRLYYEYKF